MRSKERKNGEKWRQAGSVELRLKRRKPRKGRMKARRDEEIHTHTHDIYTDRRARQVG